jgi:hypothetical protein
MEEIIKNSKTKSKNATATGHGSNMLIENNSTT